jgi:Domain of unknown function (DUF4314)
MVDNATFYNQLQQPCPVPLGTRIELLSMPDDPNPIPAGTRGTVTGGNGAQMYVDWDTDRSLILAVGVDRWRVIQDG